MPALLPALHPTALVSMFPFPLVPPAREGSPFGLPSLRPTHPANPQHSAATARGDSPCRRAQGHGLNTSVNAFEEKSAERERKFKKRMK